MNPTEYQRLAGRTECDQHAAGRRIYNAPVPEYWLSNECLRNVRLLHAAIGMMGEVGELAGCLERHVWYGKDFDAVNFKEEVGDLLWYIAEACNALGLDMGEIAAANIAKLQKRYPDKFDGWHAAEENRDRAGERKIIAANHAPSDYQRTIDREVAEQNGHGFAEPPECCDCCDCVPDNIQVNIPPHCPLDTHPISTNPSVHTWDSYQRVCKVCKSKAVHNANSLQICPDCYQDIKSGRVKFNG